MNKIERRKTGYTDPGECLAEDREAEAVVRTYGMFGVDEEEYGMFHYIETCVH